MMQVTPKENGDILPSFQIKANKKTLTEISWKCPDKQPCSKATSILGYLRRGDRITVHSNYSNAQWKEKQTIMYMVSYM